MKKITKIVTVATVFLLIFSGCEKKVNYHQDRYIGNWDFVTRIEHYGTDYVLISCDTIYYLGTITCGESENRLKIQFTESLYTNVIIDEHGNIYTICPKSNCKTGNFEGNNKVSFKIINTGPGTIYHIAGTKREEANNE